MKFLHLSDLHIGLKLINKDLKDDQEYILDEIAAIAAREQPDAVVIAGDIYDKAIPSAEAVEIFDHFVSKLSEAIPDGNIMMISGNHDSAARINVFRNVLRERNIHMIGKAPASVSEYMEKVVLEDVYGPVNFYLLPFVKPSMVRDVVGTDENGNNLSYNAAIHRLVERENIDPLQRNVFVSHQFYLPVGADASGIERMESEVVTVGNIDEVKADILERFDYAALGHIHKPMKVGSEFYRYCGTPLACSASEAGQQKGVIMVEMEEKGTVRTTVFPLHPLRQVKIFKGDFKDVLTWGCNDYAFVILTDKKDLDVIDMQDRLRHAFPNLLEIRRDVIRRADYSSAYTPGKKMDAFELCSSFLNDLDESEQELLRDVIHTVWEVK